MFESLVVLHLLIGVPHDISIPPRKAVEVARETVSVARLQISADKKVLRIIPNKTGSGVVVLTDSKTGEILGRYLLDVREPKVELVKKEIAAALKDLDGIQIRVANNKVLVDGEVISPTDIKRIHSVVKMYPGQANSIVTISPNASQKLAKLIEKEIGNPEIRVKIVNGHILLEGYANSPEDRAKAEIVAQTYAPDIVVDEAVADKKILKVHPN